MGITTEFEFTLPEGYVDENGALHKTGVMRLATAADEVLPLKFPEFNETPHIQGSLFCLGLSLSLEICVQ